MARTYSYPHWETNVVDNSIYTPLARESLPLFLPIFFMRTQQGPVGIPQYCADPTTAKNIFGEGTFDYTTKYFSRESLYLQTLLARQGAFMVRMASSDATYASLVLELQVKKVNVVQYQRDEHGQFIVDSDTLQPIPETDESGQPISEPGLEFKWTTRPMNLTGNPAETIDSLKATTHGSGDNQYTVYPILAVKARSVGEFANDTGIKFFTNVDDMDDTLVADLPAIEYNFGAVKKAYQQDNISAILSSFQNQYETFFARPNSEDTRTARKVYFDDIITNYYADKLPWDIHLYSDNIKLIGEKVIAVETNNEELDDPYLVNLCEPYHIDGTPYSHVTMSTDDDSVRLNSSRVLYLMGGDDGTIDDAAIEELTRQYLTDNIYPEILDQRRYPFTHIIDVGVAIETKYAFIDFLGKHDAFKVILSTQNSNLGRYNTKAEDFSTGSALFARCLLQPESMVRGTECCRAEIYQQAGRLADSTYTGIVPSTFDIMTKKSKYLAYQSIAGQPAGLPNSAITVFKDWNWTPCDADGKQDSWDSGLNYFQYYDMTGIHWPANRTVYRYDTSVLSNAMFTDVIVFVKHIVSYNWARFSGIEAEFAAISSRASEAVSNDISAMLNGFYKFSVQFYQTEEDANLGWRSHCTVQLWGNPQQRVWAIDIECYRSGYDPTTAEA